MACSSCLYYSQYAFEHRTVISYVSDLGSSQSSRSDRVARASMKPSTYNLGSVKVTESSQLYNAKYIKG